MTPKEINSLLSGMRTLNSNICCIKSALTPNATAIDYENTIAYNPTTGEIVIVSFGYAQDGTISVVNYNPDGTLYTGPTPVRGAKDFELSTKEWFCVNNTDSVSRVDIFIDGVINSSIWQSLDGTVIPAPTSGTYTAGTCGTVSQANPYKTTALTDLEADFPNGLNPHSIEQENQALIQRYIANEETSVPYTQTVRIVSDYNDVVRTEDIAVKTEVIPVCYNGPGNIPLPGLLTLIKDNKGDIQDSYITAINDTPVKAYALSGATIVSCNGEIQDYSFQRTIVPCAVTLDGSTVSGFSFVKDGHIYENNGYSTVFYDTSGVNSFATPVFIVSCPKLICLEQNGVVFKGYVIDLINTLSINKPSFPSQTITLYFDENYLNLDDSVDPITQVSCSPVGVYNNVKHEETNSTPIIIPANTVHSISYKIISGIVDITIGADTLSYQANESDTEEATELINQQYTFTPQPGGLVKVKTIY